MNYIHKCFIGHKYLFLGGYMKTYFLVILLSFSAGLGASSSNSQDNDNNEIAEHFKTALDIIHSHIAALGRPRTGNPTHNQAALITDYETLSSIIQSVPYYLPTPHSLAQLHNYRPDVTYYCNTTTLEKSQNFAFNKINMGINLIPQNRNTLVLIERLRQAISLLSRDFNSNAVDEIYRQNVAEYRTTAQKDITSLHDLDVLHDLEATDFSEETPTTSSSSSTTIPTESLASSNRFFKPISKVDAEKQQEEFFDTEKIAEIIARTFKKRARQNSSCDQTKLDDFFKPHKDDDDENIGRKKQKTSTFSTSSVIFIK